jgi:hypothetical protein
MKISELIGKLTAMKEDYGDVQVAVIDREYMEHTSVDEVCSYSRAELFDRKQGAALGLGDLWVTIQ